MPGFKFRVPRLLKAGSLAGSVALIVGATLLPFGVPAPGRTPPAWCLECGALWLTDAIANVALFVPFGLALAMFSRRVWPVPAAALCFSMLIELLQSIGLPPGRSPALADIITNTIGGAIGAALHIVIMQERTRTACAATWLAVCWTTLAGGVFALTARALGQVTPADDVPLSLHPSPFEHVPGHGWYGGITDSAAIGDTVVRRGWSGPIILAAGADHLPVRASVWVRSTDPLGGQIPLLFIHQRGDSAAWLQIAKRDNDAELTVMRRAWTWGLNFPSVIVPNAFRGRATNDSSTVALSAHVTPSTLTLQHGTEHVSLPITPLLGWTLIQPVFTVQSAFSGFAQWSWVWLWMFPIGWWGRRSAQPLALTVGLSLVACGWLALLPRVYGLAPLSPVEWGVVLTGLACGAIVAPALPGLRTRVK